MSAEPIRLQTTIDTMQAKASHRTLKEQVVSDHTQMQAASRRTDQSMFKLSQTTSMVAGLGTAAFSGMAAGIAAAKTSSDNLGSSLASIGASLTAAYLSRGEIGLAIGLLGVGIGALVGSTNEFTTAADRARIAHEHWLSSVRTRTEEARKATADLKGEMDQLLIRFRGYDPNRNPGVFDQILARRAELVSDLQSLRGREATLLAGVDPMESITQGMVDRISGLLGAVPDSRPIDSVRTSIAELTKQLAVSDQQLADMAKPWFASLVAAEEDLQRMRQGTTEIGRLQDALRAFDHVNRIDSVLHFDAEDMARVNQARDGIEQLLALAESRQVMLRGFGQPGTDGGFYSQEAFESLQRIESVRARLLQQDSQEIAMQQRINALQREHDILTRKDRDGDPNTSTTTAEKDEAKRVSLRKQRLEEELAVLRDVNDQLKVRQRIAGDVALRNEIQLLSARNAYERDVIGIYQERDRLLEAGRSPALVAQRVNLELAALDPMTALDPFMRGLTTTLGGGLADIIVDGITTGFDSAANIATQVMNQMLRSLISQIVNSGIQQLMAGILSGGFGGGGGGTFSSVASVVTSIAGGGVSSIAGSVAPAAVPIPAPGGC